MLRRLLTLSVLAAALSPGVMAVEGPWSETYSMTLAGAERTMVVHHGGSWLLLHPADADDLGLLRGRKEVVIESKCSRETESNGRIQVVLGSFRGWSAEGSAELWATTAEADNLYLFGSLVAEDGAAPRFDIQYVLPALSDAQIIARRLASLGATAWADRLKAAEWIRARSATQPNQEFWLSAADGVVGQVIEDAATHAGLSGDLALLDQAITWSVDILRDASRAGRLASTPWVRAATGPAADALPRRLRRLGLDFYRDLWRPRAEALTLEFEDRFAATPWKDADAFYRLGRWADVHGEYLPQAKDRTYRCYQAGYRADANHQGIRNELGLPNTVTGDGTQAEATADFLHPASGTFIPAPQGWKRGDRIEGDITWIDPTSETAYLSASVIHTPTTGDALVSTWDSLVVALGARPGFAAVSQEDLPFGSGTARILRYRFQEGRYLRQGELLVAVNSTARLAVRLDASFADEEHESVHRALMVAFGRLVIPDAPPTTVPPVVPAGP